jgi:hypothetical protein
MTEENAIIREIDRKLAAQERGLDYRVAEIKRQKIIIRYLRALMSDAGIDHAIQECGAPQEVIDWWQVARAALETAAK